MGHLCRSEAEWRSPDEFIPERFDSASDWALTPDGRKRHPFCFTPFLGGSRICLGKTFVESVGKIMLPSLLRKFKFSPTAGSDTIELPLNHMLCKS